MKRSMIIALMLTLCLATSCSYLGLGSKEASLADNVNGKWEGVMTGMGEMKLVFTFNIEGETLTGSVNSEMGDMAISNGKVMEDSFSFEVDAGGQVIVNNCTFSDGKIIVEAEMMDTPLILSRVSE
ncbi:hypothetical protein ACFL6K_01415 [Candidatus Latescibacterota bacterium]